MTSELFDQDLCVDPVLEPLHAQALCIACGGNAACKCYENGHGDALPQVVRARCVFSAA